MIHPRILIRFAACIAACLGLLACPFDKEGKEPGGAGSGGPAKAAPAAPPPVPVAATGAVSKDLPVQIRVVAQVEAVSTVNIRSEVTAPLVKARFNEGDDVRKGEVLFELDSREFDLRLASAAALARKHEAELAHAEADAARFERLIAQKVVSQEEYERARTNAGSLAASLAADRAQVDLARLDVERCVIRAPISGRAGSLAIHPGNLVKANDTPALVVIQQIEPIHVVFAVPEIHLAEIRRRQAEGALKVAVVIPGQESDPAEGVLAFIDSSVDPATGTIRLKGLFPNSDRRLWPGQFVNAVLTLSVRRDAVIVPSQAVQPSQKGPILFVVGAGDKVEIRQVTPGLTIGGETVIEAGVQPGERVVTDGHLRLFPGASVTVRNPGEGAR